MATSGSWMLRTSWVLALTLTINHGQAIAGTPQVSAGIGLHNLALRSDGLTLAWGNNSNGQLGDGTNSQRSFPVSVVNSSGDAISGTVAVSVGYDHSLLLDEQDKLFSWGGNWGGQLGNGSNNANPNPQPVIDATGNPLTGISAIQAGNYYSLALRSDGSILAWGRNYKGELGDGTTAPRNAADFVRDAAGNPIQGITAIAAGGLDLLGGHCLALKSNGTLLAWGNNSNGQLGVGAGTLHTIPQPVVDESGALVSNIVAIAAGANHSIALKGDGTVLAWGANGSMQLGDGTFIQRNHPVIVLGSSGSPLTGISAISAGHGQNLALTTDTKIFSWGTNLNGELGRGSGSVSLKPLYVEDAPGTPTTDIAEVSAGRWHNLARKMDGTVLSWGSNIVGELGDGGIAFARYHPAPVLINPDETLNLDDGIVQCDDLAGNWQGTWSETSCDGLVYSGQWTGEVSVNCTFSGTDNWDHVTGIIDSSSKQLMASGDSIYGCGLIDMGGTFSENQVNGNYSYAVGGSGTFSGNRLSPPEAPKNVNANKGVISIINTILLD